jgi:two-component system phosphate regulon response regulator PhoB
VKPYVMVVEDEEALATLLDYNLEKEGFRVERAADGEEGLLKVEEETPDLILLDWMLPKVSGVEVCRQLRARPETRRTPILMLTARGEETDKVRGLDTGADDYVVKPFAMSELTARIRALLRRTRPELVDERLEYNDIVLDRASRRVTRSGRNVHLGPTEFRLLDFLMQRPGRVFTRERLMDAVWGPNTYVELRTVDVHVGRLRKALRANGAEDPIRTVRSAGYSLDREI